jgi:hypothetical protein
MCGLMECSCMNNLSCCVDPIGAVVQHLNFVDRNVPPMQRDRLSSISIGALRATREHVTTLCQEKYLFSMVSMRR